MQISIGRLSFSQLDRCDAETPDVCLGVVATLFDDFWAHPVRRAWQRRRSESGHSVAASQEERTDKSVLFGHSRGQLAADTKVSQLDVAVGGQEDVGSLNVSVQLALVVKVIQPFEQLTQDYSNVVFFEGSRFELGEGRA